MTNETLRGRSGSGSGEVDPERGRRGREVERRARARETQLQLPLVRPATEQALAVYRRREDREIRITAAMCGMSTERFKRALAGVGRIGR